MSLVKTLMGRRQFLIVTGVASTCAMNCKKLAGFQSSAAMAVERTAMANIEKAANNNPHFIKHETVNPTEFDNLKIVDYKVGENNSASFAEVTVPVGVSHKLSWSNRSDKYYYVVLGNIVFTVNGESCSLSAGDFCFIRKGERFTYKNVGPDNTILVLVHVPDFKLEYEVFEE